MVVVVALVVLVVNADVAEGKIEIVAAEIVAFVVVLVGPRVLVLVLPVLLGIGQFGQGVVVYRVVCLEF